MFGIGLENGLEALACGVRPAVFQVELRQIGGSGEKRGVEPERLAEAVARADHVLFAEIGCAPIVPGERIGGLLLFQRGNAGQRGIELLAFQLAENDDGVGPAVGAFHSRGGLQVGHGAAVALGQP